jgi:Asp-tRNA(Asn)/Glu-tRNA(Gln) amidotransferase A subunit family amidase
MDHIGPMAHSVHGLAAVLQAIAGASDSPPVADYVLQCEQSATAPRLGRVRGLFEQLADRELNTLLDQACRHFQSKGATLMDIGLPAGFGEVVARHRTVMAVEAGMFHEQRLRRYPEEYDSCIRGLLEEGLACPAPEYARCKEHQAQLTSAMKGCFEGVDALLMPATTGPAPAAATTGDPAPNSPWSYTGLPTISLPAGRSSDGMPLAIQLVGPAFGEAQLFAAASWCERVLCWDRREPPG